MPESRPTLRETGDVDTRQVLTISIGFLLFVAIGMAVLAAVYTDILGGYHMAPPGLFPAPQLQTQAQGDLQRLQADQGAQLERSGWADQSRGLRYLPIERAMSVIAARGPHAYDPIEHGR